MAETRQQYQGMHPITRSVQKNNAKNILAMQKPTPEVHQEGVDEEKKLQKVKDAINKIIEHPELTPEQKKAIAAGTTRAWYADFPGAATDVVGMGVDYLTEGLKALLPSGDMVGYDVAKSLGLNAVQEGARDPFLGSKQLEEFGENVGYIPPTTGTDLETYARIGAGFFDPVPIPLFAGTTAKQIVKANDAANPLVTVAKKYKTADEFVKSQEKSYMGGHTAPWGEDAAPLHDMTQIYPDDIYSPDAVRYYGDGSPMDAESAEIIQEFRGNPEAEVTIYRAVPGDYSVDTINPGDWVTINREYAEQHGNYFEETGALILSKKVKAKEVFTDANSIHEFGYNPSEGGKLTTKELTEIWEESQKPGPIFTSPGGAAASDIAKETIPANKVKSQLEGRGVNKEEMEWTGFNEWIKDKKGEVSKAEIEEFFQQNQIEVREVVRSNKTSDAEFRQLALDRTADELETLMSNDKGLYNNREQIQPLIEKYRSNELEVTEWDELNELFDKFGYDEGGYISNYYQGVYGSLNSSDIPGNVKWQAWQLPGGENYRELVLMVPPKKVPWTKENVVPISADEYFKERPGVQFSNAEDNFFFFRTPDGVQQVSKKDYKATDFLTDEDGSLIDDVLQENNITQEQALEQVLAKTQPDPAPRYTGGHFEENDVVAHIRFNERVDPDGKKVLFIEEIQSDWAHKGQSEGFVNPKAEKLDAEIYDLQQQFEKAQSKYRNMDITEAEYMPIRDDLSGRMQTKMAQLRSFGDRGLTTPGPFVTDIHQWTNLALKRMVRWGTDNGFDSIGWVTGKQSADRYKVSKTVDSIYWNPDSTRLVAVEKGGNNMVINELVPEDKLADFIGKEPANRLLESRTDKAKVQQQFYDGLLSESERDYMIGSHSLEGTDLDIGGDYHKLIYDDVLLAQGKKIGKKYGAKVEEGAVFTESGPTKTTSAEMSEYIESGQDVEDLKKRLLSTGEGQKVWSMRLTDKLKQASKDGMPYYVALPPLVIGAAAAEQRTDAQRLQSKSDAQQILAN